MQPHWLLVALRADARVCVPADYKVRDDGAKGRASKCVQLYRLPRVLVLHLKRFTHGLSAGTGKLHKPVRFDATLKCGPLTGLGLHTYQPTNFRYRWPPLLSLLFSDVPLCFLAHGVGFSPMALSTSLKLVWSLACARWPPLSEPLHGTHPARALTGSSHLASPCARSIHPSWVHRDCPHAGAALDLIATVSHHGRTLASGHYTADVRQVCFALHVACKAAAAPAGVQVFC